MYVFLIFFLCIYIISTPNHYSKVSYGSKMYVSLLPQKTKREFLYDTAIPSYFKRIENMNSDICFCF